MTGTAPLSMEIDSSPLFGVFGVCVCACVLCGARCVGVYIDVHVEAQGCGLSSVALPLC